MQLSVVIPVHNEEKCLEANLAQLLARLKVSRYEWELLLIENGSTDETLAISKALARVEPRIRVIQLKEAGYGNALRTGLLAAQGRTIVTFDIDYWDYDFLDVAAHVMEVKYDIVIGSKNLLLSADRRPWVRRMTSFGFRILLWIGFGLRVSDTHGIKAWRNSDRLKRVFQDSVPSRHTYDTEAVIRAMYDGCEVLEVPVSISEQRETQHHIIKRIPRALTELVALFFRLRLRPKNN